MKNSKAIIEALIFSADSPLAKEKIKAILGDIEMETVGQYIAELVSEYDQREGGLCIQEIAGGFQFRTKTNYAPWIKALKGNRAYTFSRAAMETIAIVAYRQPIIKADIDRIRGVDSGGCVKNLLEKRLIRIMGRMEEAGKPILYGTTKKFLEVFNLNELSELPTLYELQELNENQ
ncbi:MAG: SMC-Scp complex subunit ScpB [Deltaproteobacteria bacterium]